jgi:hypothetical protein
MHKNNLVGKLEGKGPDCCVGVDVRMILKWILEK